MQQTHRWHVADDDEDHTHISTPSCRGEKLLFPETCRAGPDASRAAPDVHPLPSPPLRRRRLPLELTMGSAKRHDFVQPAFDSMLTYSKQIRRGIKKALVSAPSPRTYSVERDIERLGWMDGACADNTTCLFFSVSVVLQQLAKRSRVDASRLPEQPPALA